MASTITQSFPPIPLEELVAGIAGYDSLQLPKKLAFLSRLVDAHVTLSLVWGPGWSFRRARRLEAGSRPEKVDDLIWRKGTLAALGRANPAGFDVLYVADRMNTALAEARAVHDRVAVAEFAIRAGSHTRIAPIGELAQIQRTGRGHLSGDTSAAITETMNACSPDDGLALVLTDSFLLEVFLSDDSYLCSSHIARALFAKNDAVRVIAFPSRRLVGALNFAVRVDTFWQDWALVGARAGDARHLGCGFYQLGDVQAVDGVYVDGTLRWQAVADREKILIEPYWPMSEH